MKKVCKTAAMVAMVAVCVAGLALSGMAKTSSGKVSPGGYAWASGDLPTTLVNGQTYTLTLNLSGYTNAISGQKRTSPARDGQQAMDFTVTLMVKNWNGTTKQLTKTITLGRNSKECVLKVSYTPKIPVFSTGKGEIWWLIKVSTPGSFSNVPFETQHVPCTLKTR